MRAARIWTSSRAVRDVIDIQVDETEEPKDEQPDDRSALFFPGRAHE